jgi:hypothetical protein
MKNLFLVGVAVCAAVILAGCGHNAIQYGDGIGFDAGVNPENYTASFNLRYGKILSAVTRDNVEIEVTGKTDANGASGTEKSGNAAVSTDGTLKIKIGRQINGAAVDLVKAGADADKVVDALTKADAATPATK